MTTLQWSAGQMQRLVRNDETIRLSAYMTNVHPLLGEKACFVMVSDLRVMYTLAGYDTNGVRSLPHALIESIAIKNKFTKSVVGLAAGGEWYIFTGDKQLLKQFHAQLEVERRSPRKDFGTTTAVRRLEMPGVPSSGSYTACEICRVELSGAQLCPGCCRLVVKGSSEAARDDDRVDHRIPYTALEVPARGVIPMSDHAWLDASADNLRISLLMLEKATAYTQVLARSDLKALGIGHVVEDVMLIEPPPEVTEELLADITVSALFGYAVAKGEEVWGWAQTGEVHPAAHTAKVMYRGSPEGGPVHKLAVEAGYYFGRTGLRPLES